MATTKYSIEFTADEIGWLYEICEFAQSGVHSQVPLNPQTPQAVPSDFAKIMAVQGKIDFSPKGEQDLLERSGNRGKPYELLLLKQAEKVLYAHRVP